MCHQSRAPEGVLEKAGQMGSIERVLGFAAAVSVSGGSAPVSSSGPRDPERLASAGK